MSYYDTYNLHAWLKWKKPPSVDKYLMDNNHVYPYMISQSQLYQPAVEKTLKFHECALAPKSYWPKKLQSWSFFIQDYTKEKAMKNLETVVSKYGQGMLLTKDEFFHGWLKDLAGISAAIRNIAGTLKPWNNYIHNTWIKVFGSPNPYQFPGLPMATSQVNVPSLAPAAVTGYKFAPRIKVTDVKNDAACVTSANFIKHSIPKQPPSQGLDPSVLKYPRTAKEICNCGKVDCKITATRQ